MHLIRRRNPSNLPTQPYYRALSTTSVRFRAMPKSFDPLTTTIADDHQEMYKFYDQYVKASGDLPAQQRWSNQLVWQVARHAVGEEIVIYPLFEKYLGAEGQKLANHDRSDHQYVKNGLQKLQRLSVGTAEYDGVLKDVMQHLREHNTSEEDHDLPMLARQMDEAGSSSAASSFNRTKQFAPTRPHPSAPSKPPFETVVGLMTAPIDKLRDAFADFPSEEEKKSIN